jgi:hypothetical protein
MQVAIVHWVDATGGENTGWKELSDVKRVDPSPVISCGVIVKKTREKIVVCPHLVLGDKGNIEEGDGEIAIPRSWVVRIQTVDIEV